MLLLLPQGPVAQLVARFVRNEEVRGSIPLRSTHPGEEGEMRILRLISRLALGAALVYAGIGHLTFSRIEFQAQVPVWLPLDPDFVVVASGVVEILLGIGIASAGVLVPWAGLAAALFFIAIFPGNINQYVEGIDAFGLDTEQARFTSLFFQSVLVVWALWSTGAIGYLRRKLPRQDS